MGMLLNDMGILDVYPTGWLLEEIDDTDRNIAKTQLTKMVDLLRTCKGELVSVNNEPFIATFALPAETWQAIQKEVK